MGVDDVVEKEKNSSHYLILGKLIPVVLASFHHTVVEQLKIMHHVDNLSAGTLINRYHRPQRLRAIMT